MRSLVRFGLMSRSWREQLEEHLLSLLQTQKTKDLRALAAATGASAETIAAAKSAHGGQKAVKAAYVSLLRDHALGLAELPVATLRGVVEEHVHEDDVDNALDECEEACDDEREILVGLLADAGVEMLLRPRGLQQAHEAQTPRSARLAGLLADPSVDEADLAAAAQATLDLWKPQRWEVTPPVLGRGSSGVVFQCSDTYLGPAVAIKISHSRGRDDLRVLKREARLMQRVAHERICHIFEHHVTEDQRLFGMVLELLEGGSLAELIAASQDGIREFEVVRMAFDILAATLFMHQHNVIHRDIKPSNIMRTEVDGRTVYKLIDLSISAVEREARENVSKTLQTGTASLGGLAGTPHYMSPEQIAEGVVVTAQTDLWSLGVVMFECLSGVLPFAPREKDRFKICNAIVNTVAPEVIDVVKEVGAVSDGMSVFIAKALHKELGQRFSTAAEMTASLHEMLSTSGDTAFSLFISYRVWCDKEFAEALFRAASACQLKPGRENRLKVYLDKVRIVDGQRFDVNFAKGLANSAVFAPLLSPSCLKNFVELGREDKEDFVLAEWTMALELESRGIVKAIFPIVIGEQDHHGKYSQTFFEGLRDSRVNWPATDEFGAGSGVIPNVVSAKSTAKAKEFLSMLEPPVVLSEELTVDAIVKKILTFQAVLLHFENKSIESADGMEQLVRVNSTHGARAKALARAHAAQTCAERIVKLVSAAPAAPEPEPEPGVAIQLASCAEPYPPEPEPRREPEPELETEVEARQTADAFIRGEIVTELSHFWKVRNEESAWRAKPFEEKMWALKDEMDADAVNSLLKSRIRCRKRPCNCPLRHDEEDDNDDDDIFSSKSLDFVLSVVDMWALQDGLKNDLEYQAFRAACDFFSEPFRHGSETMPLIWEGRQFTDESITMAHALIVRASLPLEPYHWKSHIVVTQRSVESTLLEKPGFGRTSESTYNCGCTLMHCAATDNAIEALDQLTEAGADLYLEQCDDDGRTPLNAAAANGAVDAVEYLLKQGANWRSTDNNGRSPLDNTIYSASAGGIVATNRKSRAEIVEACKQTAMVLERWIAQFNAAKRRLAFACVLHARLGSASDLVTNIDVVMAVSQLVLSALLQAQQHDAEQHIVSQRVSLMCKEQLQSIQKRRSFLQKQLNHQQTLSSSSKTMASKRKDAQMLKQKEETLQRDICKCLDCEWTVTESLFSVQMSMLRTHCEKAMDEAAECIRFLQNYIIDHANEHAAVQRGTPWHNREHNDIIVPQPMLRHVEPSINILEMNDRISHRISVLEKKLVLEHRNAMDCLRVQFRDGAMHSVKLHNLMDVERCALHEVSVRIVEQLTRLHSLRACASSIMASKVVTDTTQGIGEESKRKLLERFETIESGTSSRRRVMTKDQIECHGNAIKCGVVSAEIYDDLLLTALFEATGDPNARPGTTVRLTPQTPIAIPILNPAVLLERVNCNAQGWQDEIAYCEEELADELLLVQPLATPEDYGGAAVAGQAPTPNLDGKCSK